jgi:hypothetical protein
MVSAKAYDAILAQLSDMDANQLKNLATITQEMLDWRKNHFNDLITTLEDTLRTLQGTFPNAAIPLVVSPTETVDLMDYIIPADFVDRCQMGEN